MTFNEEEEREIRNYLLSDPAQGNELVEIRLLRDDDFERQVCLVEDELIEDYLLDRLTPDERKLFRKNFLATPERRRKLVLLKGLIKYADSNRPKTAFRHEMWLWLTTLFFRWRVLAVTVLLLGIGTAAWWLMFYQSDLARGVVALRQAFPRPLESRISGFGYGSWSRMRGATQGTTDYVARDRAERLLLDAAQQHPGAKTWQALGWLYLTRGEFDKAREQFEAALKVAAEDARLHNDLGVTLFEKARVTAQPENAGQELELFGRALEHFNRALELNSSLPEARFNRALLYESMHLLPQARADWQKYLEQDSNSQWAEEARLKLRLLEEQQQKTSQNQGRAFQDFLNAAGTGDNGAVWKALSQSRARTGNTIVERLLDSFLELSAQNRLTEAGQQLRLLSLAGDIEEQKTGDRFTADLARFYARLNPGQRVLVTQARGLMKQAGEFYNRSELERAITLYSEAENLFERASDDGEAIRARSWAGYCYVRIPDQPRSLALFEPLSRVCEERGYQWLLAQSLNAIADVRDSFSEYSRALEYVARSFQVAARIEDSGGMLRNLIEQASIHIRLGNYQQALGDGLRAFELTRDFVPDPKQIWPLYYELALDFCHLGLDGAALEFQQEALRLALESGLPLIISRSYARLGMIHQRLHHNDEAIRNGQLALEEGRKISSEASRLNMEASSLLQLADLYLQQREFSEAVACYDQAISLYERPGLHTYLYRAHSGKLHALVELGQDENAEKELKTALDLYEQYRARIIEEEYRNSFFDAGQNLYDAAIDFAYSRRHDEQRAFQYAEDSRARSLLDLATVGAKMTQRQGEPEIVLPEVAKPLPLAAIQAQLPEQVQVLQYAALEHKTIIWVISCIGFASREIKIEQAELDSRVKEYLRTAAQPDGDAGAEITDYAKQLYKILISPVESLLDRQKQLCIIPDGILNYLPYSALVSPVSGRHLIEDFVLTVAPSASLFLFCSDLARQKEKIAEESLLAVGNPRFDHSRFPSLPDLPSAGREAEAVAACYQAQPPLTGTGATEREVRNRLSDSAVIHLAAHTVIDERSPLRSRLLLAPEPEQAAHPEFNGLLEAFEIYQLKLSRTRLVVLSSCQSGIERAWRGEGAISMARPFIAAGVPLVVASLWPVESEATAELMTSFHRHRRQQHLSTAAALRLAQLDLLSSSAPLRRRPYQWASFIVIGGYARF